MGTKARDRAFRPLTPKPTPASAPITLSADELKELRVVSQEYDDVQRRVRQAALQAELDLMKAEDAKNAKFKELGERHGFDHTKHYTLDYATGALTLDTTPKG